MSYNLAVASSFLAGTPSATSRPGCGPLLQSSGLTATTMAITELRCGTREAIEHSGPCTLPVPPFGDPAVYISKPIPATLTCSDPEDYVSAQGRFSNVSCTPSVWLSSKLTAEAAKYNSQVRYVTSPARVLQFSAFWTSRDTQARQVSA